MNIPDEAEIPYVPLPSFISCSLSPETIAVMSQRVWTLFYTVTTQHMHTHPI